MSSSKKAARPVASKTTDTGQPETQQSGWLYPTIWQDPDAEARDPEIGDNPAERADASAETQQLLDEIIHCAGAGNQVRAIAIIVWLMRGDLPVFANEWRTITRAFRHWVSDYASPVVADVVIEHGYILDRIIDLASRNDAQRVFSLAAGVRYRICEACGEYGHARTLLGKLRDQADKSKNCFQYAQLTNNHGYEFLLEGNYLEAKPYFIESLALFQSLDSNIEIANAQANLLTCQFALAPSHDWERLLPTLRAAHRILYDEYDWRIRKTMRLFAARAEARQRHSAAIAWARRAVHATRNIPTQLRRDDMDYLDSLLDRRPQGDLFGHRPDTRQAVDCRQDPE